MTLVVLLKPNKEIVIDIIRNYQSKVLYENHKMINLFVLRDRLSKSFENQVLATTNYHGPRPLIVIFHDPPELMGIPDPTTNRLELHNTWLTDVLKDYIGWAVSQGYAVIDVNIPKHVTDLEDPEGYVETDRPRRITMTEELATYLWENYIECNEPTEIFFLGVGDAYHGLLHILMQRGQFLLSQSLESSLGTSTYPHWQMESHLVPSSNQTTPATPAQISPHHQTPNPQPLPPSQLNPIPCTNTPVSLQNSRIFVASDHFVWSPERKPPKKRFGKLVKSPKVSLNEMLKYHEQDVRDFVVERIELARRVREGKESGRVERGIVVQ
ncbi:MAG: Polyamine deacetylase hdac10 [Pycnora praestabilis]|nr:MAG: Polyamine deacetylase hdac10 [Pycnora praestabilis]